MWCSTKTTFNEDEDHTVYMSWVTATCLRWEPQSVTPWLYPVIFTTADALNDKSKRTARQIPSAMSLAQSVITSPRSRRTHAKGASSDRAHGYVTCTALPMIHRRLIDRIPDIRYARHSHTTNCVIGKRPPVILTYQTTS